jgi:glycolate oxidase iron-sulfur subunit
VIGKDTYAKTLDCVHCGLCLSACPTYRVLGLETDSPRGRVYMVRALAEGQIEDPGAIRPHLDQCLGCRACEPACPSGVAYGRILEDARAVLTDVAPDRSWRARLRRFLLRAVLPHPRRVRLWFALGAAARALGLHRIAARRGAPLAAAWEAIPPRAQRRPLHGSFAAAGEPRGRVFLFTGCVMEQMFGDVNRATLEVLRANGFAVDVPAAQRCCGALLVHEGLAADARSLARHNLGAFPGDAPIIVNSAGCGAALKEYGDWLGTEAARAFATRCRDVSEFLAERGLTATPRAFPHRVAYDDPCHLCHGQGVRAQPRELLGRVPGLELVAHRDPEACCGSAGIFNLVHVELARTIGRDKATAIADSGAECVASGNPGCLMQLRAHLAEVAPHVRALHPVELLLPGTAPPGSGR